MSIYIQGILLNLLKEWDSDTCYSMSDPWKDVSQTQQKKYCMIPFIWGT